MRNSPSTLRRRANEYRSISAGIRTQEVRDQLLQMAEQFERRADLWAKLNDEARQPEQV